MGLLSECKAAIQQAAPGADVILFGSRARGDAQEDSDYDLLILVDGEPDMALEEAKLLFDTGHLHTYVNRLYYACFYAVSALLLSQGQSSRYIPEEVA